MGPKVDAACHFAEATGKSAAIGALKDLAATVRGARALVGVGRRLVVRSRAVGDSGSVTSPLIPWNSCGTYMAAALGVPTLSYAGFAFFSLLNPLLTIAIAFLGFRMLRTEQATSNEQMSSD